MVEPRQALAATLRTCVVAAGLGGLALALWSNRRGATALEWGESGPAFALAAALFAVAPLVQAACFALALRGLGAPAPWPETLVTWTRAFLLRYAPSGTVGYVYRFRRRGRLGADSATLWTATGYEQLIALAAGAAVCLAAFAAAGSPAPWPVALTAAVLFSAAAFLRPHLATRALRRLAALRRIELPASLAGRRLTALIALSAAAWLPNALATSVLVSRLAPDADISFAWLLGAYACAWLAGFVVPFAPGGLAVREAVLAGFLVEPLGGTAAVTAALALRLANTVGELLAIVAVEAVQLSRPQRCARGRPLPRENER